MVDEQSLAPANAHGHMAQGRSPRLRACSAGPIHAGDLPGQVCGLRGRTPSRTVRRRTWAGTPREETMTSTHEQQEAPGDSQPAEARRASAALQGHGGQAHEGGLRRQLRQAPEAFWIRLRQAPEALWHNRRWVVLSAAIVSVSMAAVYLTTAGKSLPGSSG